MLVIYLFLTVLGASLGVAGAALSAPWYMIAAFGAMFGFGLSGLAVLLHPRCGCGKCPPGRTCLPGPR